MNLVRADIVMQKRGAGLQGCDGISNGREGFVFNFDQFHRVFGNITVRRRNHRDRFTDVADFVDCNGIKLDRHADGARNRVNCVSDIRTRDNAVYAGKRFSLGRIDRYDAGVGMA
jgi:hypothetical protein